MTTRRQFEADALLFGSIVLALAMWRFGSTVADPDLWGHVRFGIDKIEAGSYLARDAYSYLTLTSTWFNHEWFAEVIMGWIYLGLGSAGLVVVKAALAAMVILILNVWLTREGLDPLRSAVVMVLALVLLTPTFGTFRPQIFTTVLFTLLLIAMSLFHRGIRWPMWALPPLFALWVNLHGGVLGGVVVLWVWAITHSIVPKERNRWQPMLVAALASGALLANPHGLGHLQFLVDTTVVSRPDIVEWQPIRLLGVLGMAYLVLLILTAMSLYRSRSDLDWPLVFPLGGLALSPLVATRHLQLFVPAVIILGAPYLTRMMSSRRAPPANPGRRAVSFMLVGSLALFGFAVGRVGVVSSCLAIDSAQFGFPVRGIAALSELDPAGNAVVPFNWGEYIIWHLGPELKVSSDGRRETIYPPHIHQANLDFSNGVGRWDRLLELSPADYVIQRTGSPGAELMGSRSGWSLAYSDSFTSVFVPGEQEVNIVGDLRSPVDGDGVCFPG